MRVPRVKAKLQVIQTGEGQPVNSGVDFGVFRVVGEGGWVRIVAEVDQFSKPMSFRRQRSLEASRRMNALRLKTLLGN